MMKNDLSPNRPMPDRAAVIIVHDCSVLLMRRRRDHREYYVLPGGGVESGETPEEACVREALEETGLTITIKDKLISLENEGREAVIEYGDHPHVRMK